MVLSVVYYKRPTFAHHCPSGTRQKHQSEQFVSYHCVLAQWFRLYDPNRWNYRRFQYTWEHITAYIKLPLNPAYTNEAVVFLLLPPPYTCSLSDVKNIFIVFGNCWNLMYKIFVTSTCLAKTPMLNLNSENIYTIHFIKMGLHFVNIIF